MSQGDSSEQRDRAQKLYAALGDALGNMTLEEKQ